ncbi:hypothetical protein [Parasitella parasitica]|uniref:Uncharacterized protein n=1 Tax=Parasitella parasitica TaxID=35722 RepID=A0A0B7NHP3_9FUNG|nr:hypothetical protein [Parasitella parasitica]
MIFSQLFSFLQSNKKRTVPSKKDQESPQPTAAALSTTTDPLTKTSSTSFASNEPPSTPISPAPQPPAHNITTESEIQIPQVEFEQSRSLLQLDFFGPDQQLSTNFPQFDHLLNKPTSVSIQPAAPEQRTKFGTLNRKLAKTLRQRMSTYRPNTDNKQLKRSTSSPHLA